MKIFKRHKKQQPLYSIGKNSEIMEPAYVDKNCEIGNYTFIGTHSNITRAKIGNYCSIGNFVAIGPGEHNIESISTSTFFTNGDIYKELTQKECIIGNDVWIGTKSVIRRGVTIGDGAIIGANSFVNKDVPDFAIVAGSPARIIRYRFDKDKIKKIKKSKWWLYDLDDAKKIIEKLDQRKEKHV